MKVSSDDMKDDEKPNDNEVALESAKLNLLVPRRKNQGLEIQRNLHRDRIYTSVEGIELGDQSTKTPDGTHRRPERES